MLARFGESLTAMAIGEFSANAPLTLVRRFVSAALPLPQKTRQARDLFPFWQAGQEHEHVREKYSCAGMMELSTQGAVTASAEI